MQVAIASRSRSWAVRDVVALTKPRITLMVLLTAAGGLWLAPVRASHTTMVLALLGTALVVGGANALNMYIERETDGLMKRTKDRPLPTGRLQPAFALAVGLTLSIASVPVLVFGVNATTALLAVLANLLYVLAYTPLKPRSHWALQVGAVPGAIPPLLGWTAATGRVDAGGLVLFAILFFWQIAHFHAIALFRKVEYGRAGLAVLPNVAGEDVTRHSIVRHASALTFASLLLYPLHVAHSFYALSALVLGLGFMTVCIIGLRRSARGSRAVFIASLFYLIGLFASIAVDSVANRESFSRFGAVAFHNAGNDK
jgi:protoheme IX farnesyltransferase